MGKLMDQAHVRSYHRLVDCLPVSVDNVKWIQKSWSYHFLPNKIREFILKFNGNILGLNTRVSHFAENVERSCTFCKICNVNPLPDESFIHLFLLCPTTSTWLRYFYDKIFMDLVPTDEESAKKFWFLHITNNEGCNRNIFFTVLVWLIKYVIWESKLSKKIPSPRTLMVDLLHLANSICTASIQLSESRNLINVFVSRNWDRIRHGLH